MMRLLVMRGSSSYWRKSKGIGVLLSLDRMVIFFVSPQLHHRQPHSTVLPYPISEQYIGQKLLDHPLIQTVLRQKEGVAELEGLDNVNRLYAFTAFGGADKPDFYVGVGISPAHIYAGVNRTLGSSLLGLGVI